MGVINKVIVFCLISLLLLGCATSSSTRYESGYEGLFERWSKLDSGARSLASSQVSHREQENIRGVTHKWQWPLKNVMITSEFGRRSGRDHEGVDFRARVGTPVYAASNGVVVYSGNKISGYGRMVVIKHESNLFTVYAHHSKNFVKNGEKVKQGQKIALSGRSGRVSGPHLHFELRRGSVPIDPIAYFPSKNSSHKLLSVR